MRPQVVVRHGEEGRERRPSCNVGASGVARDCGETGRCPAAHARTPASLCPAQVCAYSATLASRPWLSVFPFLGLPLSPRL